MCPDIEGHPAIPNPRRTEQAHRLQVVKVPARPPFVSQRRGGGTVVDPRVCSSRETYIGGRPWLVAVVLVAVTVATAADSQSDSAVHSPVFSTARSVLSAVDRIALRPDTRTREEFADVSVSV